MSAALAAPDADRPPDRQMDRTRQAIRAAFIALLSERGFAKLTIAAVVARANVGRSTFYEHYRTKHDLLFQSFAAPCTALAGLVIDATSPPTLLALLDHFRGQQILARELFVTQATRALMHRALATEIAANLAGRVRPGCRALLPLDLIATQLAEAQFCLVEAWVLGRTACAPEQIAAALRASSAALTHALLGATDATP